MRVPVSQRPESHSRFSAEMMKSVRVFSVHLLGLYLIFFRDQTECCSDVGSLPLKPTISHLEAVSDKQSLVVSWLRNQGAAENDIYEVQISRNEKDNIIYTRNVSASAGDSAEYSWTWVSDLPLECVDHSVRIRSFCNRSVPSPWSNWNTNDGEKIKDKRIKIFPSQRVLREGSTAMFCCVPPAGVNITSITFNNKPYPLMTIDSKVKAISVSDLKIPTLLIKKLLLTCTGSSGKNSTWNFVSFPPQKPRNLSCATSDMKNITCKWNSDRKRDPFDHNKQNYTLHIRNSDQAPVICKPSSCNFSAVENLQEYNIHLVVKDQLGEETETYSFNISERVLPVLEWDKVNPGMMDAFLSWSVQGIQMNLFCQVETNSGSITELICNSVSDLCTFKLEHLQPNTRYSTSVRCSVNGRLWGEWTKSIFFTTCPLVTLDLWRKIQPLSDSDDRRVTLLWNPHIAGGGATPVNIRSYKLKWSQGGQTWTELKDGGQNQTDVFIGAGRCDVSIEAVLQTGSFVRANITIPQKDVADFLPSKRRLSSSSAGGFNLSWDEQSSVTCGYTIEWCILGSPKPCTLKWIKVPKGKHTLFLPAGRRYLFNIYGCSEDGHTLLEIQTGYSQELNSVQSPSLKESARTTSSSITLEWFYDEDDPAQPAFITGYLVTVQEVGPETRLGQTKNLFNVSVADPRQKFVTIEGLQQQQEYICSVSALTNKGPGFPASITIRTRTNYLSHTAKILTAALILLGCIVLLWPRRKLLKNGLREIFIYPTGMNIKPPEIDSFLYETDQKLQNQKVEECISCDIEILNIEPLLHETTTLGDPDFTNAPYAPGSRSSLSSVQLQSVYCPQSAIVFCDGPTHQQMTSVTNRSYLSTNVENPSEPQEATFSDITSTFEPSDCLQESCVVIYGYI
ncbi:oncostatin-M-specific receptor subunit beta isoform X2 [Kryptolebias marmoratus]|uniref:oncostatin-M-specific receptor subunit beta isoform X2 n=1 Tax=Kryptolebias marmoratus TaxID=37003 RepID=UPI0018ACB958|nr:oncostatin-M-specific receptor subunit beta isoform X2 [Kryptolebias marmoratus]